MRELIKFGLLGLGAYLLAREFGVFGAGQISEATVEPAPGEVPILPTDTQPSPETRQESRASESSTTGLAAQLEAAGGGRPLDYDHWAWYYRQLTGQAAPAPEELGITRTDPMPAMSAAEWVALVFGEAPPASQTAGRSAGSTGRRAAGGYGR